MGFDVMKKITASALCVALVPSVASAVDVKVSGQVNKAISVYDDGRSSDVVFADNNLAKSRFVIEGEQALNNGLTASVMMSAYFSGNRSNAITQNTAAGQSSTPTPTSARPPLEEEMTRVGLAGKYGAVFIGYQDTAIDDAFYHDLGAASDVLTNGVTAHGGGLGFRASNGGALVNLGGALATPVAFSLGFDGSVERQSSLRFNSASWNGLNFSVSTSQGGDIDTNLRYANNYGDWDVDSAIGVAFENNTATGTNVAERSVNASASIKHSSGIAGTLAYLEQSLERKTANKDEPKGFYAKLSYATGPWGFGVDYAKFDNNIAAATVDHEMTAVGLGAQYDLGHGVSVAGLYRMYDADITGTPTEEINVYALNMKVVF